MAVMEHLTVVLQLTMPTLMCTQTANYNPTLPKWHVILTTFLQRMFQNRVEDSVLPPANINGNPFLPTVMLIAGSLLAVLQ